MSNTKLLQSHRYLKLVMAVLEVYGMRQDVPKMLMETIDLLKLVGSPIDKEKDSAAVQQNKLNMRTLLDSLFEGTEDDHAPDEWDLEKVRLDMKQVLLARKGRELRAIVKKHEEDADSLDKERLAFSEKKHH